jgi:hypothetical protein
MIIELAQTGERDPDFLCEAVLAALRAAGLFDHEARCWEPYALARNYDVAAGGPAVSGQTANSAPLRRG